MFHLILYLAPANLESRDWIIPTKNENTNELTNDPTEDTGTEPHFDATQDRQRYLAEVLHIIRPLCHCKILFFYAGKIQ